MSPAASEGRSSGETRIGLRRRSGAVKLVAADGTAWQVYELDAARTPGSRGKHCLVLESTGHWRRLWQYPSDWRSRNIEELLELSVLPRQG